MIMLYIMHHEDAGRNESVKHSNRVAELGLGVSQEMNWERTMRSPQLEKM